MEVARPNHLAREGGHHDSECIERVQAEDGAPCPPSKGQGFLIYLRG